jgi:transcriptional regulator with XRE-family HTH domain
MSSDIPISDFPINYLCRIARPGAAALWVEAEHYKVVGACLAAARRRTNVTQQELAGRLAMPQSFVSEYERGQRRVDVVELLLISRALGVDSVELFAEITNSVRHPKNQPIGMNSPFQLEP